MEHEIAYYLTVPRNGFTNFTDHKIQCSCNYSTPYYVTSERAREEWNKHKATEKKTMSTEDYKRGVEDVLKLLDDLAPTISQSAVRKKLLTKKVIKWVIVNKEGTAYRTSNLFDCQSDADRGSRRADGKVADYVLGVYPVEIDLPL